MTGLIDYSLFSLGKLTTLKLFFLILKVVETYLIINEGNKQFPQFLILILREWLQLGKSDTKMLILAENA